MLYLFHGENDFAIKQEVNQMRQSLLDKDPQAGYYKLSAADYSFAGLRELLTTADLFSSSRLICLDDCLQEIKADEKEAVLKCLSGLPSSMQVIFCAGKIDKRCKIVKFLISQAQVKVFDLLDKGRLVNWIKQRAQIKEVGIDDQAVHLLTTYYGSDLWSLDQELDKLSSYQTGKPISAEAVRKLCKSMAQPDLFGLIDAFLAGDKKKALQLLHENLISGMYPLAILKTLSTQLRQLICIKDVSQEGRIDQSQIAKRFKIHPFVVRKFSAASHKHDLSKLISLYTKIAQVDLGIKWGDMEDVMALEWLVGGLGLGSSFE
ncbi:MAG TPA: DNA polymerase III subunit delta [Candidatus Wirthbacteria bacterium]|nr:DNA polymerase III subunit delta [Candidatus Wirthbacteria bacterium]